MLAVTLFILFWVVVAVALVFVALRGGLGGAREALQTQSSGGRVAMGLSLAFVFIVFGLVLPLVLLIGNNANASKQIGGQKLTAAEKQGRALFGQYCGVCHTLAAANAVGKVGPNLDTLKPPAVLVRNTILYGCLQNAPAGSPQTCLGYGTMPPLLLQGRQATDVSAFVAAVAGR
jgi:mono/diheme cytochrome c family protein